MKAPRTRTPFVLRRHHPRPRLAFGIDTSDSEQTIRSAIRLPKAIGRGRPRQLDDEQLLAITFSDLASFASCGLADRLRSLIGFQPPLSPELGYGKAVHHLLREVAEYTRIWAVERPFELHLPNALVSGRAAVLLDEEDRVIPSLAIVDYKTAADRPYDHDLQLQVYSDAGRREGLTVRAAYVHDLKDGNRRAVDVSETRLAAAEGEVVSLVERLRAKQFDAIPEPEKCGQCDVRAPCREAASA